MKPKIENKLCDFKQDLSRFYNFFSECNFSNATVTFSFVLLSDTFSNETEVIVLLLKRKMPGNYRQN
jgi:hypothetical protein